MKQSEFLALALSALANKGWEVYRIDGKDWPYKLQTDFPAIVAECREYESVELDLHNEDNTAGITVIWQGPDDTYEAGAEIIADHSTRLSAILDPLYAQQD